MENDTGLGTLLGELIRDARAWASAEVDYYKVLVADRLTDVKLAVALGIAAIVLANAALIALLVGLIIALMTLVGPLLATIVVIGVTLAVAALMGRMAMRFMRLATRKESDEPGESE